jgi:hypothetical protein
MGREALHRSAKTRSDVKRFILYVLERDGEQNAKYLYEKVVYERKIPTSRSYVDAQLRSMCTLDQMLNRERKGKSFYYTLR